MTRPAPTLQRRPVVPKRPPATTPPTVIAPGGLRVLRGPRTDAELSLDEQQRYVLGRHDAADIAFHYDAVSRVHGALRFTDDGWVYEDLGSKNGSLVRRGTREASPQEVIAHHPVTLSVGDVIEVGCADARIELIFNPRKDAAAPDDDPTTRSDAARVFGDKLRLAARTHVPVFLLGPSGVGKTHAARTIHDLSSAPGPFVPLNCARLPTDPAQLHSELLGHVKGAFTGADRTREGKLVRAGGGTLFLDEVESLSELGQGFLLDVLEGSGELCPLGTNDPLSPSPVFRLISASKAPLSQSGLRDDLCERLAEGHLWTVPSLAQRTDDIAGLIAHFVDEQRSRMGVQVRLLDGFVTAAEQAQWPGEIRQLRAAVSVLVQLALARALVAGADPSVLVLSPDALQQHLQERDIAFGDEGPVTRVDARSLTRAQIERALADAGGNQSQAARDLGIARNTLAKKLRQFDL